MNHLVRFYRGISNQVDIGSLDINQILWEFPDNLTIRKMGSNEKIQRHSHAIKIINMRSTLHHEAMILRSCCDNCMQRSIFGGNSWGYAGTVGDKTEDISCDATGWHPKWHQKWQRHALPKRKKSLGRTGNPFGFAPKFISSTGLLFQFDQNM